MARGWESKSVEAQQEEASRSQATTARPAPEQLVRLENRRALELTRKRAIADLGRASAPAHRAMLERGISALDDQLAALSDELEV